MKYIFILFVTVSTLFFRESLYGQNIRIKLNYKIVSTDSDFIAIIWDACMDNKGYIYILDSKDYSIKKIDSKGNHIIKFGKEGKGPGEFILPTIIRYDQKGRIVIYDYGLKRFSIFSLNGKFLFTKNIAEFVEDFQIGKNGRYYIETTSWETKLLQNGKTVHKISIYKEDFSFIRTIYETKIKDRAFVKQGSSVSINMFRFSPSLEWTIMESGNIAVGITNKKSIKLISQYGKLLKVINPPFVNEKITVKSLINYYSDEIDFGDGTLERFNEDVLTQTLKNVKVLPYFNKIFKYSNEILIQTYTEKDSKLKLFRINFKKNTIKQLFINRKIFYNNVRIYKNFLISFVKGMFFHQPVLYKYLIFN